MTIIIYTPGGYNLDPGRHNNIHFGINYYGGIFVGTYSPYLDPVTEAYPPGTQVRYLPPNSEPVKVMVYYIPPPYKNSVEPEEDPTY